MSHATAAVDSDQPCARTISFPLLRKMRRHLSLTHDELVHLRLLHDPRRTFNRRREIVVQGRPYDNVLIVCDGIALRHKILSDGSRQGLGLILPGDIIGIPASFFATAVNTVTALTDVTVSAVPLSRLVSLFREFPRLGTALFWSAASQIAMQDERLVDLGRRSAYERLAHLIIRILIRLRDVGLADEASCPLPLTQEIMADLLGLSLPHLNRMVRLLREEGLVTIDNQHAVVHDFDSLAALAGFDEGYLSSRTIPGL